MTLNFFSTRGTVIKILGGKNYLVECDNGKSIIANVAARFKNERGGRRANIIKHSKVLVEISVKDLEKGQIIGFVQ